MNNYSTLKVLILGLGVNQGGLGAAKFFAKNNSKVRVTDLKTEEELEESLKELRNFNNIEYTLGEHKYSDLDWADLIIRNPAVKPDNPYLKYALEKGKRVEMDMGILLEFVKPSQIIGVTGTKGKSTTSSLIYEILSRCHSELVSGSNAVHAGNIGKSVFDLIDVVDKKSLIVLELSSFQLQAFEDHQTSPKYSIITNIYTDHLNYHGTMENYINAKRVIARYQTADDVLFLRKDDPVTDTVDFKNGLKSKIIYFSAPDLPKDLETSLPGEHNRENIAAALAVVKEFGVTEDEALKVIKNFKGVEFRLQLTREWNGVKIYNDTTATNPAAAIQALKSLPNSVLIAGGANKNLEFGEFAKEIENLAKAVYFLDGDATDEIKKSLGESDKIKRTYGDLKSLLTDVKGNIKEGDTILFSPGATSFNMFKNEFDRGRKFNSLVEEIFR